MLEGKIRNRNTVSNWLLIMAAVGAAWVTWYDVRAYYWPGSGTGLWRLLFTVSYFTLGWRLRDTRRRHHDVIIALASMSATGFVVADIGNNAFDALPGPDLLDAYVLIGVFFAMLWWVQAVTNADFRRMCGWTVVTGATIYRLIAWPYVTVHAFTATGL